MLLFLSSVSGCGGLGTLNRDLDALNRMGLIGGRVDARGWEGAPLVVVALRVDDDEGLPDRLVDIEQRFEPGAYRLVLEPGQYRIGAFEDTNGDLEWDEGERVAAFNRFSPVEVREGAEVLRLDLMIGNLRVAPPSAVDRAAHGERRILGRVTPIDDARFDAETGRMGLWNPMRFLSEFGAGLHFLTEHGSSKTPVLFVHGLGGNPQELRHLIEAIDESRFEAWVYHHPSSLPLSRVAASLNRDLNDLATTRGVDRVCVVGHSMGGVLSRVVLDRHVDNRARGLEIPLLVTVASPMGGMSSAGMGARMSPIVVPSWHDLDPEDSTTIHLYDDPLPAYTRYVLFYAHASAGAGTDGVVGLASQLRPEALNEAEATWGFVGSHTGILRDPATSSRLSGTLEACAPTP